MRWLRSAALLPFRAAELDVATPQGRSRERFRRIGLTTTASVAARGIAFGTGFITVPLTLHYLGTERYGMWATLSSVIALASFADFGLGNGLLNALAGSHGRDDREAAQRQVSSAFVVLVCIALALGAIFALAYGQVEWARLFNVSSAQARREAGPATAVFVACFLVNLPIGIVARIRQGYQEGYRTSFFEAAGNVLGLLLVLLAIRMRAPLAWLVAAMAGAPVLASAAHAGVLFGRDRRWLRVRLELFDGAVAKRLLHHGLLFFALQLAASLVYAPDNLIVAQLRGPDSVARFAVAAKLFSVSILLADVTLGPLWPAYGEAMARGDHAWVRHTLTRSIRLAAAAALGVAVLLVLAGNSILSLWVGPEMVATSSLLLGLGAWTVIGAAGTAVAMYLNAANLLWIQVVCSAFMVPASLALKVVFVNRWGLAGVPWGLVVAYVTFVGVPLLVLAMRGRLAAR